MGKRGRDNLGRSIHNVVYVEEIADEGSNTFSPEWRTHLGERPFLRFPPCPRCFPSAHFLRCTRISICDLGGGGVFLWGGGGEGHERGGRTDAGLCNMWDG